MKHSLYPHLSRGQYIFGLCYLVAQQFLIPYLIVLGARLLRLPMSDLWLNFAFFCVNFLAILAVFGKFLYRDLKRMLQNFGSALATCAIGFAVYWAANILVSLFIALYFPTFQNANDANISTMAESHYWIMFTGSVVLVPVVEETLFRGVVFGLGDRFARPLAYALSTLLFAFIHVVGYLGTMTPTELIISILQYLPAGLCLGWAYAKSRTIFVPTLIHTTVNLLGMLAMR